MNKLLKPYLGLVICMIALALLQQALNLLIPKLIGKALDTYAAGVFSLSAIMGEFSVVALGMFACAMLLAVLQALVGEKVARDVRTQLAEKISRQDFLFVERKTSSVLLTNFSSDIEAIKQYVSMAFPTLISSVFVIVGAAGFLISINWRLGLAVLTIVPLIGMTMMGLFGRVGPLFKKAQEVIDRLNAVINENILGASLVRVLNAHVLEYDRFVRANAHAKEVGMQLLRMFAAMIPLITIIANAASVVMVVMGGAYIMNGTLSIGDFAAFMTYLGILMFPIFMLGFMSTLIGRANASYARIAEVLAAPEEKTGGQALAKLHGKVEVRNVSLTYGEKMVVENISFTIAPGTKTAIIGPTAAGKTQLLYLLTGLTQPDHGEILYDDVPLVQYDQAQLRTHVGMVFQESILFHLTLRENIAFGQGISEEALDRAIQTAELQDFIASLPQGLETMVSERGTSLSGGQKQRVMLARALAHNPTLLILDDFTARVDARTEEKILANISKNYPNLTLISVTQKIYTAEKYDQIMFMMEREILATGTHAELLETSPEYVQIVDSQRSTNTYER